MKLTATKMAEKKQKGLAARVLGEFLEGMEIWLTAGHTREREARRKALLDQQWQDFQKNGLPGENFGTYLKRKKQSEKEQVAAGNEGN